MNPRIWSKSMHFTFLKIHLRLGLPTNLRRCPRRNDSLAFIKPNRFEPLHLQSSHNDIYIVIAEPEYGSMWIYPFAWRQLFANFIEFGLDKSARSWFWESERMNINAYCVVGDQWDQSTNLGIDCSMREACTVLAFVFHDRYPDRSSSFSLLYVVRPIVQHINLDHVPNFISSQE